MHASAAASFSVPDSPVSRTEALERGHAPSVASADEPARRAAREGVAELGARETQPCRFGLRLTLPAPIARPRRSCATRAADTGRQRKSSAPDSGRRGRGRPRPRAHRRSGRARPPRARSQELGAAAASRAATTTSGSKLGQRPFRLRGIRETRAPSTPAAAKPRRRASREDSSGSRTRTFIPGRGFYTCGRALGGLRRRADPERRARARRSSP